LSQPSHDETADKRVAGETVKLNNDCNEGYSLLTAGNILRQSPHYDYTCVPAWH